MWEADVGWMREPHRWSAQWCGHGGAMPLQAMDVWSESCSRAGGIGSVGSDSDVGATGGTGWPSVPINKSASLARN